jgi:hypothetical protein
VYSSHYSPSRPKAAGLTPKPHHAHQTLSDLRGSLRLRLASTFNHRPNIILLTYYNLKLYAIARIILHK